MRLEYRSVIKTAGGNCAALDADPMPDGVKKATDREYIEVISVCDDCVRVGCRDSGKESIAGGSA